MGLAQPEFTDDAAAGSQGHPAGVGQSRIGEVDLSGDLLLVAHRGLLPLPDCPEPVKRGHDRRTTSARGRCSHLGTREAALDRTRPRVPELAAIGSREGLQLSPRDEAN